jgi:hypothetical protein
VFFLRRCYIPTHKWQRNELSVEQLHMHIAAAIVDFAFVEEVMDM